MMILIRNEVDKIADDINHMNAEQLIALMAEISKPDKKNILHVRPYGEYIKRTNKELSIIRTPEEFDIYTPWIKGGFIGFEEKYIDKHLVKTNVRNIDINSAYPFQMTKPLPYGQPLDSKPNCPFVSMHKIYIKRASMKAEYSNMPELIRDEENHCYVRELSNAVLHIVDEEGELLQKYCDIEVEKIETKYFKTTTYNFAKDFKEGYAARKVHPELKEVMVILIGMFALNIRKGDGTLKKKYWGSYPPIHIGTTARTRCEMIKKLEEVVCSGAKVITWITDGIIFEDKDNLYKCDSSKELGQGKEEENGDEFILVNMNTYKILKNNKVVKTKFGVFKAAGFSFKHSMYFANMPIEFFKHTRTYAWLIDLRFKIVVKRALVGTCLEKYFYGGIQA